MMYRWLTRAATATLAFTAASACENQGAKDPHAAALECAPVTVAAPESLRWRRRDILFNELGRALELTRAQLCSELGDLPCEQLHQVALGSNDPFGQSMYRPVHSPLPVTPTSIDRLVLSACLARVNADAIGPAVVFTELDLKGPAPGSDAAGVRAQVESLFRRLHGRDPSPEELAAVAELGDDESAFDFATLACYAIGTTTEKVLF